MHFQTKYLGMPLVHLSKLAASLNGQFKFLKKVCGWGWISRQELNTIKAPLVIQQ